MCEGIFFVVLFRDGGKKVEKNVFFRKVQADLDRNVEVSELYVCIHKTVRKDTNILINLVSVT